MASGSASLFMAGAGGFEHTPTFGAAALQNEDILLVGVWRRGGAGAPRSHIEIQAEWQLERIHRG